jgi:hypothetical protein
MVVVRGRGGRGILALSRNYYSRSFSTKMLVIMVILTNKKTNTHHQLESWWVKGKLLACFSCQGNYIDRYICSLIYIREGLSITN